MNEIQRVSLNKRVFVRHINNIEKSVTSFYTLLMRRNLRRGKILQKPFYLDIKRQSVRIPNH